MLIPRFILLMLVSLSCALGKTTPETDPSKLFGSTEKVDGALIGIFYDLKQTQDRKSSGTDQVAYNRVVARFVDSGWHESALSKYFRATKPVYATQLWIPNISANSAPKAFGVEDFVKPTRWIVHYKGQVVAPKTGVFRFVGIADNVMAVGVNSETVLISYIRHTEIKSKTWKPKGKINAYMPGVEQEAFVGDWFSVQKGETIDLDLLFGERPGGGCWAFLMLEEAGVDYEKAADGRVKIPPFQLNANALTKEYPQALPWSPVP